MTKPADGLRIEGLRLERPGFTLSADLAAPPGAVCALLGPSGAGKSSLLDAIAGFEPIAAGRISVGARDLAELAPAERPMTLLFQENNLFPSLSAAENVALAIQPNRRPDAAARAAAAAALAEVGLEGFDGRRPTSLSGGQRQRVALARALLRDRPLLLLDEPFAALGPAQRADMVDLVRATALPRGATVLMVTHDPDDARRGADLLAFCAPTPEGGRIDGAQPAAAALSDPDPALAAYLGGP